MDYVVQPCTIAQYITVHTTCETTSLSPGIKINLVLNITHQLELSSRLRGGCVICEGSLVSKDTCNSHKYFDF